MSSLEALKLDAIGDPAAVSWSLGCSYTGITRSPVRQVVGRLRIGGGVNIMKV